jgi:hypothetical protein
MLYVCERHPPSDEAVSLAPGNTTVLHVDPKNPPAWLSGVPTLDLGDQTLRGTACLKYLREKCERTIVFG